MERVRLLEVDGAERREAVGAFPRQIPHGVQFLRLPADPDEAMAIADPLRCVPGRDVVDYGPQPSTSARVLELPSRCSRVDSR